MISDEMLAMRLQLEEIRRHTDQKGKFRADRVPDLQLALTAFQAEIDRHIEFLNDVRFANSLANAVHDDARIIAELGREEIRAEEDRRMALELGGVQGEPLERHTTVAPIAAIRPGITIASMKPTTVSVFAPSSGSIHATEVEGLSPMAALAAGQMAALKRKRNAYEDGLEAASSKTYTEQQHEAIHKIPRLSHQYTICTDMFRSDDIIRLDCKHIYCHTCLKQIFMHAASDIAYFPPRCCNKVEIPIHLVSNYLSTAEMENYTDAAIEVKTPKRTYCSNMLCGKFIPPANIDADSANCTRCGTLSYIHCKGKRHQGDCPRDEALRSTLALATREGWKRCHVCQAVVELREGCYHITYALKPILFVICLANRDVTVANAAVNSATFVVASGRRVHAPHLKSIDSFLNTNVGKALGR